MRKTALLMAVLLILLSACGKVSQEEQPKAETTTVKESGVKFELDSIPDIGEYKTKTKMEYFYPEGPLDEFVPSEDYGAVVPYFDTFDYQYISGFATADGKIITRTIYSDILTEYNSDGSVKFYMAKYSDGMDSKYVAVSADGKTCVDNAVSLTGYSDEFSDKYIFTDDGKILNGKLKDTYMRYDYKTINKKADLTWWLKHIDNKYIVFLGCLFGHSPNRIYCYNTRGNVIKKFEYDYEKTVDFKSLDGDNILYSVWDENTRKEEFILENLRTGSKKTIDNYDAEMEDYFESSSYMNDYKLLKNNGKYVLCDVIADKMYDLCSTKDIGDDDMDYITQIGDYLDVRVGKKKWLFNIETKELIDYPYKEEETYIDFTVYETPKGTVLAFNGEKYYRLFNEKRELILCISYYQKAI